MGEQGRHLDFKNPRLLIPLVILSSVIGFLLTYIGVAVWTPTTSLPDDGQYTAINIVPLDSSIFGEASYHIDYIQVKDGRPEKYTVRIPFPVARTNTLPGVFQDTLSVNNGRAALIVRPDNPLRLFPSTLQNLGGLSVTAFLALVVYFFIYCAANILNHSD